MSLLMYILKCDNIINKGWSLQYVLYLELQPGSQSVTVKNCL